ncbi:TVP38/TMEM64 family protein [Agathobacter sp.]
MSEKNKRYFKIAGFILAVIFIIVISYFIGKPMVRFASDPAMFRTWVDEKGFIGGLAFMGMVVFQVLLAVIPGGPFEVCAGYAFGVWKGALLCDLATTVGSVIVFLFVRRFGTDFVELFVSREKIESVKFLKSTKKSESIIFLLFLIPGTPKDLLSYLVGLTDMKLSHWIFITFVGRFPAVFLSALGGGAVGTKRYDIAIAATVIIILLYIVGLFVYRYHNRENS